MQRLLELLNKISPAEWAVASSGALLGAVLSGVKSIRSGASYFIAGLLCGLVFPPWIKYFIWKYPDDLHLGIVTILAVTGFNIIRFIRETIREKLKERKLMDFDISHKKGDDD